jgi:sugar lactone lactonase YvrE
VRIKALLVNLGVLLGSLAFLFVVLEGVARLLLPRPQTVFVEGVVPPSAASDGLRTVRWSRGVGGPSLHRVTETGLRLNPNVHVTILYQQTSQQDAEVRTNSLGYRGEEVGPKTEGEFRILALGDSITIADYAPEEETYPAHIERALRGMNLTSKSIRALNAGVGSIDLRSEFMILMETGLSTKPDVVVVGLYLNDADPSFTLTASTYPAVRWSHLLTHVLTRMDKLKTLAQYQLREQDRQPELARFLSTHPASGEADWTASAEGFNREIANAFGDWGYAWTDEAWTTMGQTLELMQAVARDNGFELFVLLLPVRHQVQAQILRDEPQKKFEAVVARLGLPHLDLLPAMREKYAKDRVDIFYDHCHYRPEGNALVGRLAAELIARESVRLREAGRAAPPGGAAAAPRATPLPPPAPLERPSGLALAPSGELLIADAGRGLVARARPDGTLVATVGSLRYQQPGGVTVDARGVVHVADTGNHRIVRLAASGEPIGVLEAPSTGLQSPRGVATTPQDTLLVANTGLGQIVHYYAHGEIGGLWGSPGSGDLQLQNPTAVAASEREVFVADYGNARIQVFTHEGAARRRWPVIEWRGGDPQRAPGVGYLEGRIYASDPAGNAVLVFAEDGRSLGRLTSPDLREPGALAVGPGRRLFVAGAGSAICVLDDGLH